MANQSTPLLYRITPYLPKAEILFIGGVIIGAILMYAGINSVILKLSLACLAATFFLFAFRMDEIPFDENEKFDFTQLLMLVIAPRLDTDWCSSDNPGYIFLFHRWKRL